MDDSRWYNLGAAPRAATMLERWQLSKDRSARETLIKTQRFSSKTWPWAYSVASSLTDFGMRGLTNDNTALPPVLMALLSGTKIIPFRKQKGLREPNCCNDAPAQQHHFVTMRQKSATVLTTSPQTGNGRWVLVRTDRRHWQAKGLFRCICLVLHVARQHDRLRGSGGASRLALPEYAREGEHLAKLLEIDPKETLSAGSAEHGHFCRTAEAAEKVPRVLATPYCWPLRGVEAKSATRCARWPISFWPKKDRLTPSDFSEGVRVMRCHAERDR